MQIDSCVQIILITRFFYPLSVHKYNTIAPIKRSFEQQRYNFVREVISLEGRASRKKSFTHRLTPRYLCIRFNFFSLPFFLFSFEKKKEERKRRVRVTQRDSLFLSTVFLLLLLFFKHPSLGGQTVDTNGKIIIIAATSVLSLSLPFSSFGKLRQPLFERNANPIQTAAQFPFSPLSTP